MMIKAIPSPASSGGKMNLINLNTRAYIYRYLILLIMTQKKTQRQVSLCFIFNICLFRY